MAESKQAAPKAAKDLGGDQVQKAVDTAEQQGFYGRKVDPRPNSDYSLESGPESPSHVESIHDRVAQVGPEKESPNA